MHVQTNPCISMTIVTLSVITGRLRFYLSVLISSEISKQSSTSTNLNFKDLFLEILDLLRAWKLDSIVPIYLLYRIDGKECLRTIG